MPNPLSFVEKSIQLFFASPRQQASQRTDLTEVIMWKHLCLRTLWNLFLSLRALAGYVPYQPSFPDCVPRRSVPHVCL